MDAVHLSLGFMRVHGLLRQPASSRETPSDIAYHRLRASGLWQRAKGSFLEISPQLQSHQEGCRSCTADTCAHSIQLAERSGHTEQSLPGMLTGGTALNDRLDAVLRLRPAQVQTQMHRGISVSKGSGPHRFSCSEEESP